MALVHRYTLVCDDVRREYSGQAIIVGLYTSAVTFNKLPGMLPRLTFFDVFDTNEAGEVDLAFRIAHVDTGALAGAEGRIKLQYPASVTGLVLPLTIQGIQFQMDGKYAFTMNGKDFEGVTVQLPVVIRPRPKVH